MSYVFDGEEEEKRCALWMLARLKEVKETKSPDQKGEVEDLLDELANRVAVIEDDGPRQADEWYDNLWERFIFSVTGIWLDEAEDAWEPPFEWRQWEFDDAKVLKFGYSNNLIETLIPKGGGSATHSYAKPPKSITWKLEPITQKDVTFFVGKAKVAEIDAVCSVPQLPAEITSEEAGLRVLNAKRGDDEWQRRVEARRVLSITNFIDSSDNIIANAAILYAPKHKAIDASENGKVTIDFERFLHKGLGRWSDHHQTNDLRPIWLIDGQHRTRGLAQAEKGYDLEIPIILFPPNFSLGQSAKIFAEINTLQKKLSALHTLFMQHRFRIPSPIAKRDFRRGWDGKKPDKDTWDSRANNLSYECAAYLTSSDDGPLKGRIRMLDQNAPRIPIIQASQWVDFSRFWYMPGQMYEPGCEETQDDMNLEVENFFRAVVATCNHDGWTDRRPRWAPGGKNKGLCQRQGPSQALLKLYPTVWAKAKEGTKGVITEKRFMEVLKPLKWVDWLDSRLVTPFGGSGERPRTALRIWMQGAIQHGKCYPLEQVMADNIHSEYGRGMLSSPGDGTLKVEGSQKWPASGKPVVLAATQPANTLSGSKWILFDSNGVNRSKDNPTVFAENGKAEMELHYEEWMRTVTYIEIHVDWHNTISPPGKAKLTLRR